MSETKWTAGPWKADEEQAYIFGPECEMIAELRGYGAGLPMQANARLIASAPELYRALEAAIRDMELSDMVVQNCLPQCRAALALARGGE